jgi:hypothetical protein
MARIRTTLNLEKKVNIGKNYAAEWQYINRKSGSNLNRWIRPFRFHIDFCMKAGVGFRIELARKFYVSATIKPRKNKQSNAKDI